ncbi:MAG: M42 family metallopeptidase [Acutalibacteraceae bacterium]|jgi:putative aminopeptidase FrvX
MKRDEIRQLCALDGVSGRESAVRDWLKARLEECPAVRQMKVDPLGNLLVWVNGRKKANKTVLFSAHMDEVGMIVSDVSEDGYLALTAVGGVDPAVVFGRMARVNGRIGVIGGKAIHQCKDEERKSQPGWDALRLDIGVASKEEALAIAQPGDSVVFDHCFEELGDDRIKAKALDDRMGCLLLLEMIRRQPEYDIVVSFVVQEEIGLRGSTVAGFTLRPDIAVVVETTTALDLAGVCGAKRVCEVGKGPVVSFMDRRTLYDEPLYRQIRSWADEAGIPNQTKTVVAGGNDAGALQRAGEGARVAAVSLACRYLHSPACVLSWKDAEDTLRLLHILADRLPA